MKYNFSFFGNVSLKQHAINIIFYYPKISLRQLSSRANQFSDRANWHSNLNIGYFVLFSSSGAVSVSPTIFHSILTIWKTTYIQDEYLEFVFKPMEIKLETLKYCLHYNRNFLETQHLIVWTIYYRWPHELSPRFSLV